MAIQMRRGLNANFDPTKMLPGEWAVSIDEDTEKQIVYMCFRAGTVKRIGTFEDLETELDPYKEYCDSAKESCEALVTECQTAVTDCGTTLTECNTTLTECNTTLTECQTAVTNAQTSETNAKTSETNAKTSETNAETYRDQAKAYRDEASQIVDIDIATYEKAGIVKPDPNTLTVDSEGLLTVIGGGSDVEVTQVLSTGTKIASIKVDDTTTDLYAPNGGSGGGGTASDVTYDNTESGLTATDVQDAVDELAGRDVSGVEVLDSYSEWEELPESKLTDNKHYVIKADYESEIDAEVISFTGTGITATNVQDAIIEVKGDIPTSITTESDLEAVTTTGKVVDATLIKPIVDEIGDINDIQNAYTVLSTEDDGVSQVVTITLNKSDCPTQGVGSVTVTTDDGDEVLLKLSWAGTFYYGVTDSSGYTTWTEMIFSGWQTDKAIGDGTICNAIKTVNTNLSDLLKWTELGTYSSGDLTIPTCNEVMIITTYSEYSFVTIIPYDLMGTITRWIGSGGYANSNVSAWIQTDTSSGTITKIYVGYKGSNVTSSSTNTVYYR